MSTPQLDYALVDVFAEHALEGNQLAIFTDARGLATAQMQALAREMNLAETTFIVPEEDESQGVRVRIFTVQEELPFAGHPTLGTAAWVYMNQTTLRGSEEITLRLNGGPITVRFEAPAAGDTGVVGTGVFGTMRQHDPVFGSVHSREEVAEAIGMAVQDIDPGLPVQTVSTGLPFCIVPLVSLAAIARLSVPQAKAQAYLAKTDAKFFYCTTAAEPTSGADFHSRMQFYNGEDPATGSASGCAIAYLVRHGVVPSGRPTVLEQGVEMGRPSRIYVRASVAGYGVTDVFVGGRTIPVARGRFFEGFPTAGLS
jgi:trans-2,3-dihydro-3-hydroxyanthranilate isomerase